MLFKFKSYLLSFVMLSCLNLSATIEQPVAVLKDDTDTITDCCMLYKKCTKEINQSFYFSFAIGGGRGSLMLLPLDTLLIPLNATVALANEVFRLPELRKLQMALGKQLDAVTKLEHVQLLLDSVVKSDLSSENIDDVITSATRFKQSIYKWLEISCPDGDLQRAKLSYSHIFAKFAYDILKHDESANVNHLFDLTWKQWLKSVFCCKKAHVVYRQN